MRDESKLGVYGSCSMDSCLRCSLEFDSIKVGDHKKLY